jgi:hypothetical protein
MIKRCLMAAAVALLASQAVAETHKTPPTPSARRAPPTMRAPPSMPTSPVKPAAFRTQGFVYRALGHGTTTLGDPLEEVWLAQLDKASPPLAHAVKLLRTNDSASEWISLGTFAASPNNLRVAMGLSVATPDGVDLGFEFYDLKTGATMGVNDENGLGWIHRSTCDSPAFDAFLESERKAGVPESTLKDYDYAIDNSADAGNILADGWVDDEVFYIRWQFYVKGRSPTPVGYLGQDTFDLQVRVSDSTLVSCTAPASLGRPPGPTYVLSPAYSASQPMRLDEDQIRFYKPPNNPRASAPRSAVATGGNIPK